MVGCGDVHGHTTCTPLGRAPSPRGSSDRVLAFFPPPSLVLSPPSCKDVRNCNDVKESFQDSGVP